MRFFLSISKPELCLHQSLTFAPPEHDEKRARRLFRALMDNLHNRFPAMASLYVREFQGGGGVHYHVLFFFFDELALPWSPSRMGERMRKLVFEMWNGMQGGRLVQRGNRLKAVVPDPRYFLDKLRLASNGERTVRGNTRWWGCWNRAVMSKYMVTPPRETVDNAMERYFDFERMNKRFKKLLRNSEEPKRGVFSRANIRALKADPDDMNFENWKAYKQRVAGVEHTITDEHFRAVLNARRKTDAAYRPPSRY